MKSKLALANALGVAGLLICTVSSMPASFAAEGSAVKVVKIDSTLKYKPVTEGDLQAATDSFMADLILKFSEKHLLSVPLDQTELPEGVTVGKGSAMFVNEKIDRVVFVRAGVKLSDTNMNGQLLKMQHGVYGYHQVTSSGVSYAVVFTGFTEKEAMEAVSSALVAASNAPVHSSSYVAMIFNTFVPSAFAVDCVPANKVNGSVSANAAAIKAAAAANGIQYRTEAEKAAAFGASCLISGVTGAVAASKTAGKPMNFLFAAGFLTAGAAGVDYLLDKGVSASVTKVGEAYDNAKKAVTKVKTDIESTQVVGANGKMTTIKQVFLNHPALLGEFLCGVVGSLKGMKGNPLRWALEGKAAPKELEVAINNELKQAKFAALTEGSGQKAAAETAVAAKAEKGATKVVAASSESSAASAESSAAKASTSAAKAESTASKSAAKSSSAKVEVAKSEVAPVSASSAAKAESAAESAAPASFKPANFAPKNVVQFSGNSELKNFMTQAGLKEAEAKPVLDSISKLASGAQLASYEERMPLINAMTAMKPEQKMAFQAKVIDLLKDTDAKASAAAAGAVKNGVKSHAAGELSPKVDLERVKYEFKHADRTIEVTVDPNLYPELQAIPLKIEEKREIAELIARAEEEGKKPAQIKKAIKDADNVCNKKVPLPE
jgi:hypothetical protein